MLDLLGKIFASAAATPREQFQATLLQLQGAHTGSQELDSRNQSEAWERLTKFAQSDDAVGLDSLVLLAQRQLNLKSEIESSELVRRLQSHPLSKAAQKLLAVDLQIQAQPDERETLVTQAIADWKDADAAQLAVLATWLNGKGEFQRQLDVIPLDRAIQTRELFLQHLDALGALGRWDEIDHLLDSERYPLDPVIQRMYLARANTQLGQEAAAKNNWQRALEEAAGDVGKLVTLAEYAEKNGAVDVAESAYTRITETNPQSRAAWQGRLRTVYASRETKNIHAVLTEMLKLWPNDTAIQNDEAYTRLLLLGVEAAVPAAKAEANAGAVTDAQQRPGLQTPATTTEELIAIENLAQELVRQEPASLPHRTLLALALVKQNRPLAALQVYDGIQVATNALTPSALAVHAAVLAANDRMDDARAEMKQVPVDKLLPEEQAGTADLRQ